VLCGPWLHLDAVDVAEQRDAKPRHASLRDSMWLSPQQKVLSCVDSNTQLASAAAYACHTEHKANDGVGRAASCLISACHGSTSGTRRRVSFGPVSCSLFHSVSEANLLVVVYLSWFLIFTRLAIITLTFLLGFIQLSQPTPTSTLFSINDGN
jgi:hypothetical protein